jgi:lipoyl(octanoyl) transferase
MWSKRWRDGCLLGAGTPFARKICYMSALGYHARFLNVNADLGFDNIIPCGIRGKAVSQM